MSVILPIKHRLSAFETGNSTKILLGISASFTGNWETVEDWATAGVSVAGDNVTDGTLYIETSNDLGVTLESSVPFTITDASFDIPKIWNLVERDIRIRYENGTTAQTGFFVMVTKFSNGQQLGVLQVVGDAITDDSTGQIVKSVITGKTDVGDYQNVGATPSGNLKATLFDSQTNSRQIVDLNGAAKMGEAIILVGDKFGGFAPNALQWDFTDLVGSGASLTLDGTQRIETGTTADSEMRFQSVKSARFMISQFNIFHGGIELDNISDTECERRFGAFDPINANQNGVYFALIDGDWNVAYCKDGVETLVPQANWNGTNKDLFNANPALSVYEIQYNAGSIFFFQGPNFIHRVSGLASPYAALYDFKVSCEVINTDGNTTNNGINFRALGVYRLGEERGELISRVFTSDTLIKTGAGYCEHASLSRNGSTGGAGSLTVYDGTDNTGIAMAQIDVGGDDLKGLNVKSTFSDGLFIEISGSGTNSGTIGYE